MIGAIAGDIIGSVYESHPIKTKDFPLFHPHCSFTDDTVLTGGMAEAYYGFLESNIVNEVKKHLAKDLWKITEQFCKTYRKEK